MGKTLQLFDFDFVKYHRRSVTATATAKWRQLIHIAHQFNFNSITLFRNITSL